jgi:hypothetical protein
MGTNCPFKGQFSGHAHARPRWRPPDPLSVVRTMITAALVVVHLAVAMTPAPRLPPSFGLAPAVHRASGHAARLLDPPSEC